jgi:uncharacterized protein (DUF1778 family)
MEDNNRMSLRVRAEEKAMLLRAAALLSLLLELATIEAALKLAARRP